MSPFDPWLSTYPCDGSSGPLPERPWWRLGAAAIGRAGPSAPPNPNLTYPLTRIDAGPLTEGRIRVSVPPPPVDEEDVDAYIFRHVVAAVDAYDDAHPRPVPPPMCGQVWVFPNGQQEMITRVLPAGGFSRAPLFPVDGDTGMWFNGEPWPVASTVLVAGPHAPWAPKGYAP